MQLNVDRGREASSLARVTADELGVDVVLMQEPFWGMEYWVGWELFKLEGVSKAKACIWMKASLRGSLRRELTNINVAGVDLGTKHSYQFTMSQDVLRGKLFNVP